MSKPWLLPARRFECATPALYRALRSIIVSQPGDRGFGELSDAGWLVPRKRAAQCDELLALYEGRWM
jgi:hypothetical protein